MLGDAASKPDEAALVGRTRVMRRRSVPACRALVGIYALTVFCGCGTPFQAREHITLTTPLPVGKLVVENLVGEVFVRADVNADEVRAEIIKIGKGFSGAEADRALGQIRVSLAPLEGEPDTVLARAEHPSSSGLRGYAVQWRLVGPPALVLDVHNGVGDLAVDGFEGGAMLETKVGEVTADNTAGQLMVRCGVGDVTVTAAAGPVDIRVGTGSASLRACAGPVAVNTGVGDIRADDIRNGLTASTSTGDIRAEAGGHLDVRTGVGDVRLRILPTTPGAVVVRTGTGELLAEMPTYRRGRLVADTDVGSLRIRLENVTMRNVRHRRHHFEADLNGGIQPTIDLTTNVGDLTVESYVALATTEKQ